MTECQGPQHCAESWWGTFPSWKKKAALTEAQRELKLPEHNLITECPTRWGSKEIMFIRVLEQAKAISQVLSGDRYARSLIPTWQDMDVMESIHKALHPLLEFTDALSGEEYVSISYLKPVLHLFATSVLAEDAEDTDLTKSIKTKVLAYLNDKYGDPNIMTNMETQTSRSFWMLPVSWTLGSKHSTSVLTTSLLSRPDCRQRW